MSSIPTSDPVLDPLQRKSAFSRWLEKWYFPAMAIIMIVIAITGFAPSIVDPSRRRAPLTPLVAVHGLLLLLWLILFLLQTVLVAARRVDLHRRMGIAAVALLTSLVPLSYMVTVQMLRRGFDLSGDQVKGPDPYFGSIFNFFSLVEFAVLAGIALAYRRRTEIHKRLMLFATMSLMGAPFTHLFGHYSLLSPLNVLAGLALLFFSAVARDYLTARRIHPLTAALAMSMFLLLPIQAMVGSTAAWHRFARWLAR